MIPVSLITIPLNLDASLNFSTLKRQHTNLKGDIVNSPGGFCFPIEYDGLIVYHRMRTMCSFDFLLLYLQITACYFGLAGGSTTVADPKRAVPHGPEPAEQ